VKNREFSGAKNAFQKLARISDARACRYLERLILLHGTWSYRRISQLVCYFLYKNLVFSFPQFIWSLMNGFSSLKLYVDD